MNAVSDIGKGGSAHPFIGEGIACSDYTDLVACIVHADVRATDSQIKIAGVGAPVIGLCDDSIEISKHTTWLPSVTNSTCGYGFRLEVICSLSTMSLTPRSSSSFTDANQGDIVSSHIPYGACHSFAGLKILSISILRPAFVGNCENHLMWALISR